MYREKLPRMQRNRKKLKERERERQNIGKHICVGRKS
jgi:hypothetical protein